ncbi:MAG: SDR family oxidoreductase [Candidatus Methylomirabilales bacterium]
MRGFTDQIAVVTGASSGIGKAIALALAEQGATIYLVGRRLDALEEVAAIARKTSPLVLPHQGDLTLDQDVQDLVMRLQADVEHVDVLVHSAGVISLGHVETTSVKDFDWQYSVNVRAPYILTQTLLPMIRSCQGQIVFINSTAGRNAAPGVSQYAVTKHALKALADSLRGEVNADGIRVLSVFVGRTATPMQAAVHEMEGRTYSPERLLQPEDVAAVVINALSLPRTAEVTDISIRPLIKPIHT